MTAVADVRTQASGSSFYAGMRILPKAEREAMFAVYAFCRAVDDIADDVGGAREERRRGIEAWRRDIEALYAGDDPGRAGLVAEAVRRFGLVKDDFLAVIDGMQMDAAYSRILDRTHQAGWAPPRARARLGKGELLWMLVRRGLLG